MQDYLNVKGMVVWKSYYPLDYRNFTFDYCRVFPEN